MYRLRLNLYCAFLSLIKIFTLRAAGSKEKICNMVIFLLIVVLFMQWVKDDTVKKIKGS